MRCTASADGADDRQNTCPLVGSSQARSKSTPSSAWILRSASCAACNSAAVTPTNPVCTSMNFGMRATLLVLEVCLRATGADVVPHRDRDRQHDHHARGRDGVLVETLGALAELVARERHADAPPDAAEDVPRQEGAVAHQRRAR